MGKTNINGWKWFIWRPIIAGKASLEEIERYWSIGDLADCNEILDIQQEIEEFEMCKAKQKGKIRK